ncbi:membrane protein [Kitasatospora sp. MMS16-BH015]|uniref:chaplin n=1 Tax=Kitasatospora sp. MMS16-BH015 TaxID=2018025 RepID=UPI000CA127AE|nr:chaplin [Kitasatospora sp. MMS16-BH015]AUG77944.1 membrane protein [Kitasatospora sp. MMS16-BH015]
MQNVKKAAVLSAAAAGLVLAGAGSALASSEAEGVTANSPGVASGNSIQVPVHIPVNLCGNSVNVIGLLNPAFGNSCANVDAGDEDC